MSRRAIPIAVAKPLADLHDVQMFLGHADITTTSRYLQSTPVRLARALTKLEGNLFAQDSHKTTSEAESPAPKVPPKFPLTY